LQVFGTRADEVTRARVASRHERRVAVRLCVSPLLHECKRNRQVLLLIARARHLARDIQIVLRTKDD